MTRTFSMAVAATAIALTPACAQEQVDTSSREAIEQVVYDYLLENPEVIEEALIALSQKRQFEEDQKVRDAIAENQDKLVNNSADYSIGPADAKVTVVEFFDYRCGYCKRSASWATGLPEKYDNQVRVVFKELPILSAESEKAALAAIAAGKQGKYVEMHMALMELDNSTGFGPDVIDAAAESIGVDVAKMRADMKSVEVQKTVADSKSLARTLGISGTPNFVIGSAFVGSADITQVEALIQTALADS
ncbi:MAG: thioredoxin domain-containing protein [Henriciella sp.]|nr:thioredoxin domain-containing protein [Henriciella sp.]